jgi:hypothetical protein
MSQDAREVRVDIRHHTLAAAAPLRESADGEVFVALDDPPPVRTILAIHDGDEGPHALEVTRVIETDSDASSRGVFGRFRDAELLRGLDAVGTEHLATGEQAPAASGEDAEHAGYLAMPAPVVDPDPSDRIDVNELRQLEEGGGDEASEEDEEGESDGDVSPAASASGDQPIDGSPPQGRRRRGRKRRTN